MRCDAALVREHESGHCHFIAEDDSAVSAESIIEDLQRAAELQDRPSSPTELSVSEEPADAFLDAVRGGDLAGLHAVLADDVVLRADGGGKVVAAGRPLVGRDEVAHFFEVIMMKREPPPGLGVKVITVLLP